MMNDCVQLVGVVYQTVDKITESKAQRYHSQDFPGGAVVKNSPANAGDTGSIPGPGRSHMPPSN